MRFWFSPRRSTEATQQQLAATGASGGWGVDPIDGTAGYQRLGAYSREVPSWTLEKARANSVAAWRSNPMARAIVDTITSFSVGDSGVTLTCPHADVRLVAQEFWNDPKNTLPARQEELLRGHMLLGETLLQLMVGSVTGVTRFAYHTPEAVSGTSLEANNPLWPSKVHIKRIYDEDLTFDLVQVDDESMLRQGEAMFWADWKALPADRRGMPFLTPILDWLDSYDNVLHNLVDRTALARYLVWDVTIDGDATAVDAFVQARGGLHAPRSGSVEVHNQGVTWEPKTAQTGAAEDVDTAKAILTNIAGGSGLAKTWLADPEDSNRATSLTMAEPVRRRVGGVQNIWLSHMTELVRFAVDQAVVAGRLPSEVTVEDKAGERTVRPSEIVAVSGPEIAAADAQVNAGILVNLATGLAGMVDAGLLSKEAATELARRGWENFMGVPYQPELDVPDGDEDTRDDIATAIDNALSTERGRRQALGL